MLGTKPADIAMFCLFFVPVRTTLCFVLGS
jgi:hypothetical protein